MKLEIEESVDLKISARSKYSDGGKNIEVNKSERYAFKTSDRKFWMDSFIPSRATGFNNWLINDQSIRIKGLKCFELIGTIGTDDTHIFRVGMGLDAFTVPIDGVLYFFANDHPKLYWNNLGNMKVTVTRVA